MIDNVPKCPFCGNQVFIDSHTSSTYCKSRTCNGKVVEQGKITYEQEVNLHENDDHSKKQTRFGGYESKTDAFKDKLLQKIGRSERKDRKAFNDKFDEGEHLIHYLSSCFAMYEAITKEVLMKYRQLLFEHVENVKNKSFRVVAAVAYELVVLEKKRIIKDDKKLKKITQEVIQKFTKLSSQQITQMTTLMNLQHRGNCKADISDLIQEKSIGLPYSQDEQKALRDVPKQLMDTNLIKGEKDNTIISVVQYCVAQLSRNPQLSTLSIETFAERNQVTKETVKKLWNTIVNNPLSNHHIPDWPDRRSLQELRPLS